MRESGQVRQSWLGWRLTESEKEKIQTTESNAGSAEFIYYWQPVLRSLVDHDFDRGYSCFLGR